MLLVISYKLSSKEKRDSFFAEICQLDLSVVCEKEKGCVMYKYFMPCDDDCTLLLVEKWETPENQKLHCTQPHTKKLLALKEKYGVSSTVLK